MNVNAIHKRDIQNLKKNYIIHSIIFTFIIIFNFILMTRIIWLLKLTKKLFLFGSLSGILLLLIPLVHLMIIALKKISRKFIKVFKIINLFSSGISIGLGLFLAGILMMNAIESPVFYKECPFSISSSNPNSEECNNNRCILNEETFDDEYGYEYFCNYNPTKDFEEYEEVNVNIICEKYENLKPELDFNNELINEYLKNCDLTNNYFICQRNTKPKSYDLSPNISCPNKNYLKIVIAWSILNILLNLIFGFIPWKIELNIYRKILRTRLISRREQNISHNSTKNSSKIVRPNELSKFHKQPTETLIVCTETNLNMPTTNSDINGNQNDKKTNNDIMGNSINLYINKNIIINNVIPKETKNIRNEENNNVRNINISKDKKNIYILSKNIKDKISYKNSAKLNLEQKNVNNIKNKMELIDKDYKDRQDRQSISFFQLSSERMDLGENNQPIKRK